MLRGGVKGHIKRSFMNRIHPKGEVRSKPDKTSCNLEVLNLSLYTTYLIKIRVKGSHYL